MHIVGCVASCSCVWWMYKHWFVLFMFVCVINFISRLIFEPAPGTSERVRQMWEINFFTKFSIPIPRAKRCLARLGRIWPAGFLRLAPPGLHSPQVCRSPLHIAFLLFSLPPKPPGHRGVRYAQNVVRLMLHSILPTSLPNTWRSPTDTRCQPWETRV